MSTLNTASNPTWGNHAEDHSESYALNLWGKYLAYADSQKENRTLWFFISLMVHGVLFLPIPAVLMFYYNAPITVLIITMVCFFANFIANMGGADIRTTLFCFAASVIIHIVMVLAVVF